MPASVIVSVEGVLSEELGSELQFAQPVNLGITLLHAFASTFSVVLSTLEEDPQAAETWLQLAGVRSADWVRILPAEVEGESLEVRLSHLDAARRLGYVPEFFADADPAVARALLERNIIPLCCPHPSYARYSFLPDSVQGAKAWDELEGTLHGQKLKRGSDRRAEIDDEEAEDVLPWDEIVDGL